MSSVPHTRFMDMKPSEIDSNKHAFNGLAMLMERERRLRVRAGGECPDARL